MKAAIFAFAVLFASVSAGPQPVEIRDGPTKNMVPVLIESMVQDLVNVILERNLDPYFLEFAEGSVSYPDPAITASGFVQNVNLEGLSNIILNSATYDVVTGRLTVDISVPGVHGSVGLVEGRVEVLDTEIAGSASGSLTIGGIRLTVLADIAVSTPGSAVVRRLDFVGSIDTIYANLNAVIQGVDVSDALNEAINVTLVEYLKENAELINERISYYALLLLERYL